MSATTIFTIVTTQLTSISAISENKTHLLPFHDILFYLECWHHFLAGHCLTACDMLCNNCHDYMPACHFIVLTGLLIKLSLLQVFAGEKQTQEKKL